MANVFAYEVEVTGLEPAASWSQTKHSTKLSYASIGVCVMGEDMYIVRP